MAWDFIYVYAKYIYSTSSWLYNENFFFFLKNKSITITQMNKQGEDRSQLTTSRKDEDFNLLNA